MKHVKLVYLLVALGFVLTSCSERARRGAADLLRILPEQIINESGSGSAYHWFDEQDTSDVPRTRFETPGNTAFWPASIIIDLGSEYRITRISLFDGAASEPADSAFEHDGGALLIQSGLPFNWKNERTVALHNTNRWEHADIRFSTRYVRLVKINTKTYTWENMGPYACDLNINELILLGVPVGATSPKTAVAGPDTTERSPAMAVTMDGLIGINAFHTDNPAFLEPFGMIREYRRWWVSGVLTLTDSIEWTPDDGPDPALFYEAFRNRVCVDIHRHVDEASLDEARPDFGGNPEEPASYGLLADFFYQFAARYGRSNPPTASLRYSLTDSIAAGSGCITWMEAWNEPDRWWGPPCAHFSPYQLAAMASAVYDGHLGNMGAGFGARQADPSMNLALAGLASLSTDYVKAIKLWSDTYRNGSFPADAISFHHYCNSGGGQTTGPEVRGISPEADNLKNRLQDLVNWRNSHLPGKEVWLSEFGWDTGENTPYSATGHAQYPHSTSSHELQAIWLVRTFLAGSAAGIDRMQLFMLGDETGTGAFKTSGLIDLAGVPKKSWYYVSTLSHSLKGLSFSREILSGNPDVRIYEFLSADHARKALVLWCPTSDGTQVPDFQLSVPEYPSTIRLIELVDNKPKGHSRILKLTHGTTQVPVTEKPVFILMDWNGAEEK